MNPNPYYPPQQQPVQKVAIPVWVIVLVYALALSGCAGLGNAATTPVTPRHGDGGNFLPFYVQQLQQPQQPKDDCGASLLAPCDEGSNP